MSARVLGGRVWPTTTEIGVFHTSAEQLAAWNVNGFGSWSRRPVVVTRPQAGDLVELLMHLLPLNNIDSRRRLVLAPLGRDWTLMFTNGARGSDIGLLPGAVASDVGCDGLRVVDSPPLPDEYPAVMLQYYTPSSPDPLNLRRAIVAMDDGGRWKFDTEGQPFDFEDVAAYSRRRVRDRFTSGMLDRYLEELGVPALVDDNVHYGDSLLVEHQLPLYEDEVEIHSFARVVDGSTVMLNVGREPESSNKQPVERIPPEGLDEALRFARKVGEDVADEMHSEVRIVVADEPSSDRRGC